jgi:hypothetical protein
MARQVVAAQGKNDTARRIQQIEDKILPQLRTMYADDNVRAAKGRAVYDKTVKELGLDKP